MKKQSIPKSQEKDFRTIWLGMTVEERHALAKKLRAKYPSLQQIAGGFRMPSLRAALRMLDAIPELDIRGFDRAEKQAGKRGPSGARA